MVGLQWRNPLWSKKNACDATNTAHTHTHGIDTYAGG